MRTIEEMVKDIKIYCLKEQQKGLIELTEKFDGVKLKTFLYHIHKDIEIEDKLKEAIKIAKNNIYKFHKAEYKKINSFKNNKIETSEGITCWKSFSPIENVGIYIPNKLFSSVLMNIIPAKIAGCKNIIVCTPPNPSNEVLWTLKLVGINQIYTIGGAQAIFAMAYGIGEISKVYKIFGPGNEFVDFAKKMVSNEVAIDMPAGPSEVLIIADEKADKPAVIFDLLAQLEHGKESKAWLFCNDGEFIKYIKQNIENIAMQSSRAEILKYSLKNLTVNQVNNIDEAIEKSNKIAPEHLILNIFDAEKYLNQISNAGSVFVGRNTPESLGDYLSGTNHVLPTNGFAKAFSGLSVLSFGKFTTFQTATKVGFENISQCIKIMAEAEGLEFHGKSINRENI